MNDPNHFSANLKVLKQERQMTMAEFSAHLQIPKSTLQSVMENGQTTLDTACRIANALQLPLSTLTGGEMQPERADVLHSTMVIVNWYRSLPGEKQKSIREAFAVILSELER